mmetsp:Transcript_20824/g.31370  ORF Transcript_20824/g.31370 Transcript_20824/m.31370 type:complete len:1017 (+) Transcript_20824:76-3126(+)|eukprot:CAMPEP_0178905716 /NCGR_PEP_ID=MMETSP0786-20121207/6430_1 /TAXON_ID=186022 /ORGANISM="Thalassionema frauenfeldii, Strain CCMP 1798" /LENGTH=1016 /DNA_ID=CAMNT_0020577355 /DNA_START=69 /DNA_END=3119 /DNA_ORIENTATION=+
MNIIVFASLLVWIVMLSLVRAFMVGHECVNNHHILFSYSSDSKRAGSEGYSVLRQPVQWDPNKDPTFEAPSSLQQADGLRQSVDWLNQRSERYFRNKKTSEESETDSKQVENSADLDLFQRTLDTLDYPIVLNALRSECSTRPGRDIVESASQPNIKRHDELNSKPKNKKIPKELLHAYDPLSATTFEGAKERYKAVEEMRLLMDWQSDLLRDAYYRNRQGYKQDLGPPPIGGIAFDLAEILQIADDGNVLEGPEILEIATMMDGLQDILLWSKGLQKVEEETVDFIELPKFCNCMNLNVTLQELLHDAFEKGGKLNGKTFPLVGQLRSKIKMYKSDILGTLDSLISDPSIKSKLALESGGPTYSEINGRIVIPIDLQNNKASLGIVHDSSRSGKTVYVEPTEIVEKTNELRQAEAELRMEEARVWRSLTEQILKNRVELEASVAAAGQLDLVMARVSLGNKWRGIIPEVGREGIISLREAKHPVLLLREVENIVGSDVDLGSGGNQGLVLTGPNSGGKTVILKLLGLMALMTRNGIPIPAEGKSPNHTPRVDFFDPVLADIGDLQSVGGDLSTFSGHMLVCREVLASSGRDALVLMDELGSGTDPSQGVAIAQALLEALVDTGARCAITTHYMELKQLAASDSRFAVAGMQFVGGRPTYKLLMGTVGESFALAVAERFKLPQNVLDRANELLDQETRQMGDLILELENQKAVVDAQVEELAEKKREMERLKQEMAKQQQKLEAKQLSARRDEARKFAKNLEEKEQILEDVLEKLKKDPSRKIVAKSWDDIKFTKRDALNEAENVASVLKAKAEKKATRVEEIGELIPLLEMREKPNVKTGDKLVVCKKGVFYGMEGVVMTVKNKNLMLKVGNAGMQVTMKDVALPNSKVQASKSIKPEKNRNSKAAEKALSYEKESGGGGVEKMAKTQKNTSTLSIRTKSNTVDVRGCSIDEAKSKITSKFGGQSVIYVLHGYGERAVLRTKIREWLKSEKQLVRRWNPAGAADGGDSFTKVEFT